MEAEYERRRVEAERLANQAASPADREAYHQIAEAWQTLLANLRRRTD